MGSKHVTSPANHRSKALSVFERLNMVACRNGGAPFPLCPSKGTQSRILPYLSIISNRTSGTHAQAPTTKTVRGEEVGREEGAKEGGGKAGRGG